MKLSPINNKKGQIFAQLGALATGVLTVSIVLVVVFLILSQAQEQIGATEGITCLNNVSTTAGGGGLSVACNATHTLTSAVADIPGWIPLIILAVIGSILLSLVGLFGFRRAQ